MYFWQGGKSSLAIPVAIGIAICLPGCHRGDQQPVFSAADETAPPPKDPRAVPPLTSYEHVNPTADKAWQTILDMARPELPPGEWAGRAPTQNELAEYRASNLQRILQGADLAKEFAVRYPHHPRAREAQGKEMELLGAAVQFGATNSLPRLIKLEEARLADPTLDEFERYSLKSRVVQQVALAYEQQGSERVLQELERGVLELRRDFPKRPEPYDLLLTVAQNSPPEVAKRHAQTIMDAGMAKAETREAAGQLQRRLARIGKPMSLKFRDLADREFDIEHLRGKVVLVVFWSTWAGPAVKEITHVQEVIRSLQQSDFEVVGISLDADRSALVNYVQHYQIPWPNYFDGKVWDNEIAIANDVSSLPGMWLVDRKGILRDVSAKVGLETKIKSLLAEK